MGSKGNKGMVYLGTNLWPVSRRVSGEENDCLAITFLQGELDEVLAGMKPDSAPGTDGFPIVFFKRFWGTLKGTILKILNEYVLGRIDIARLNFGILTLIPKVQGADSIRQFRPIAIINVIFKFDAKAFAMRLSPIAHRIIDRSQSAFIKGRFIHEGILALNEISHEVQVKKLGGVFLKLDFEKAYDWVNWDFLQSVLDRKGFDPVVIHRLMQLVSGGQTAININGEVGPYFRNVRGVSQGDPLSPVLFYFVGDTLAMILERAREAGHIQGLVPHLIPGGVSHL